MTILRVAAIAAVCLSLVSSAIAQTGAPAVSGQVRSADADAPLRRARIVVIGGRWTSEPYLTDNEGRFRIEVPGAGAPAFTVFVTKGGYVNTVVNIERSRLESPLLVRPQRAAAISGVVVDSMGAPAAGVTVTAARVGGPSTGLGTGAQDSAAPRQYTTTTDDLGEYRLGGLTGGRYEVWGGNTITIIVDVPRVAGSPVVPPIRQDIPPSEKTVLAVETAEEIGGVHLVAPARNAADLALQALRDSGKVPPNANASVLVGSSLRIDPQAGPVFPIKGSATLRGRVLSATRAPIAGATVMVEGLGIVRAVRTDQTGAFTINGVPPGHHTVQANAEGHMPWQYGQGGAGRAGRAVAFAADQTIEGFEMVLPPGRAISGYVVDEHGEAVAGASVQVLQVRYAGGRTIAAAVGLPRTTDDRGRYRLWGLQPGSYLLSVSLTGLVPAGPGHAAYPTIYFPATPTVAAAVPIDAREDATANLALTPLGLSEVRGVARDGDSVLVSGTARLIESRHAGAVSFTPRSASVQMDGSFLIRNVPPGQYVLQVRGDGPGRTGLYGTQELLVGLDPVTVIIPTSYGTNVEGRVVFDGAAERSSFRLATVALDDLARDPTSGVVRFGSNEFFVTGLFGRTSLSLQAPEDWYLKSWTLNGAEVVDTGYDFGAQPREISDSEIVVSRNGAAVTGRAENAAKPVDDYFVVVFPVARELRSPGSRWVKFGRSAMNGEFRVGGLPQGDYLVAAVSQMLGNRDAGEWQNPDLMLQLEARAQRVTLREGQSTTVSLRLIER